MVWLLEAEAVVVEIAERPYSHGWLHPVPTMPGFAPAGQLRLGGVGVSVTATLGYAHVVTG